MLHLSTVAIVFAALINIANTAPTQLQRRIDQIISDATKPWQSACITAGGTQDKCSGVAVSAFTSLLEAGDVCDQQNAADAMIGLAKQLGNNPDMIRLAQIFVQQPRNSPEKQQIPYCQVAANNTELNGLFHCQFAGSDFTSFSGDQTGNVPLGLTALSPAGSCPANPEGPVPDGLQLNTLVQSPFAAGTNADTGASAANSTTDNSVVTSGIRTADPSQVSSVATSSGGTEASSSCIINP